MSLRIDTFDRYDALSSCLVDFKGRATVASVKNFQTIKSEPMTNKKATAAATDPSSITMQMGKVRHNKMADA